MKSHQRVELIVRGRVQGVGFRYYTRDEAVEIGVTGEVKNLPDGSVNVIAEGERSQLEKLIETVRQGPILSRVTEIQTHWLEATGAYNGFSITH